MAQEPIKLKYRSIGPTTLTLTELYNSKAFLDYLRSKKRMVPTKDELIQLAMADRREEIVSVLRSTGNYWLLTSSLQEELREHYKLILLEFLDKGYAIQNNKDGYILITLWRSSLDNLSPVNQENIDEIFKNPFKSEKAKHESANEESAEQ